MINEFGTLRREFKKLDRGHTVLEKMEYVAVQVSHSRLIKDNLAPLGALQGDLIGAGGFCISMLWGI